MKIIRASLISLIITLLASLAFADLYFEQKVTISGVMGQSAQTSMQKVWLSRGDMCMEDSVKGQKIVYRADSNILIIINLNNKTYTEITAKQFKQMTGSFAAMMGQQGGMLDISLQKTGKIQRIGSWNCYQVLFTTKAGMGIKIEMWLTKDIKYDKTQYEQYQNIFASTFMSQEALDEWKKLEGFPIRTNTTIVFEEMKIETQMEVTKMSYAPAPKDIFTVPAGFQKKDLEMPPMPH